MFSGEQAIMNGDRRQKGVSLLTLALLLLLLGGALMAGVSYYRAQLSSDAASSQKEALVWADHAIIGFASTQHRLPCPAATPTGGEDCTLAKGWLPASALNLDVTMYAPGVLPMRYMVYRNPTTIGGNAYAHRDLAASQTVLSRTLPFDAYEPPVWDNSATQDNTDDRDVSLHIGRYTGRETFNNRNGLDLCETARLAYSAILSAPNAGFAHYLRGGTVVNVAYGVAASGLGDASGNNNPFDGVNAGATAQMAPPDQAHSSSYNDYVFVRDLPSYMSAVGCPPAHYAMLETYIEDVGHGSFKGLDGYAGDIASATNTAITNAVPPAQLLVDYQRDGVAAATVSSVDTVAIMVDAAAEVEALRQFVADSADSTMIAAIQQVIMTAIGIATAIVSLIANVAALVKAIAAIVASLGLDVGAWVAAVAYGIGIALSGVAIGLSIASMGMLIAAAVQAGNVAAAVGGDTSKISDLCNAAGSHVDKQDMLDMLNKQRADLVAQRNSAQAKRDAAFTEYNRLKTAIDNCNNWLLNNKPLVTLDGSTPVVTCTATQYDDRYYCFDNTGYGGRGIRMYYQPFMDLTLYQAKEAAQKAYDEAVKQRNDLNSKIAKLQDTSSVDDVVNQYREALVNIGATDINAKVAAYRQNLLDRNAADLAKAIADRNALNVQIPILLAAYNSASQAVTDAENNLRNASVANDWTNCTAPQSGTGTVYCSTMYNNANCRFTSRSGYSGDLRYFIVTPRAQVPGETMNCIFGNNETRAACNYPYYYSIWLEYKRADDAYRKAVEQLAELDKNIAAVNAMDFSSCASGSSQLFLWPVASAREVLRRVDRRAVLQ